MRFRAERRPRPPSTMLCTLFAPLAGAFALWFLPLDAAVQATSPNPDPRGYAASALGLRLGFEELETVLVDRHALSQEGRGVLQHQVQLVLLEALATQAGIQVTPAEVNQRWREIDEQMRAAGGLGLLDQLSQNEVDPELFRETLRLGLAHERLTRRALGIPPGEEVSGEQQRIWLEQTIEERGLVEYPPPFDGGLAATCGEGVVVSAADYTAELLRGLDPLLVQEACYQLLLAQLIELRIPPAETAEAEAARLDAAVEAELERRRAEAAANPAYGGIPIETLLGAQGFRIESWPRDPSVRVAALAMVWADALYDGEGLKAAYAEEPEYFEGRFGEAVRARLLLLTASSPPTEECPRSFDQAERECLELKAELKTEQEFAVAAAQRSQDALTRRSGGDMGWVAREDPRIFAELREAIFAAAGMGRLSEGGRIAGPLRLPEGYVLFWISEWRPSPPWEEMSRIVHRELRRRLVEESLPREALVTFRDPGHHPTLAPEPEDG